MSREDEAHGHQHDVEERHEIIRLLHRIDKKLDVLLKSAVAEKDLEALRIDLKSSEGQLRAATEAATPKQ